MRAIRICRVVAVRTARSLRTFAEQLQLPLLVPHDDAHSLTRAVELDHFQYFVIVVLPTGELQGGDAVLAVDKLESEELGAAYQRLVVGRRRGEPNLPGLFNDLRNNGVAESKHGEEILQLARMFVPFRPHQVEADRLVVPVVVEEKKGIKLAAKTIIHASSNTP